MRITSSFSKVALIALALAAVIAVNFIPDVAAAAQHAVAFVGPENLASLALVGSTATTIVKEDTYTGKQPMNAQPAGGAIKLVPIPINFPAAAPVANDTHALIELLPGVQVIDFDFFSDDLDSNGTPTTSLSVGELNATLADLSVIYQSAITIPRTGGLARFAAASAAADLRTLGAATLATRRVIGIKWDTASATYVASKTGLLVLKVVG